MADMSDPESLAGATPEAYAAAARYWGALIQDDKRPSQLLEALLEGIAEYIVRLPPLELLNL
jgi:hypothetical protein